MANEKRILVYFDDLVMALTKAFGATMDTHIYSPRDILSSMQGLHHADAVEVVHGRWEDEHSGKYANPRYRCSVCKKRALYKFERDLLANWKEVQALTPNCPYCMAKLDGGKEV